MLRIHVASNPYRHVVGHSKKSPAVSMCMTDPIYKKDHGLNCVKVLTGKVMICLQAFHCCGSIARREY